LTKEILVRNINDVLGGNFLSSTKKIQHLSNVEKEQMSKELRKYFVNSLSHKKETLKQAIDNKNKELLQLVVHELKGSSGTIGFNNISEICREIESTFLSPNSSWENTSKKCEELFTCFKNIELSFVK